MGQMQRRRRIRKEIEGKARSKVLPCAFRNFRRAMRELGAALRHPRVVSLLKAEIARRTPRLDR